MRSAFGKARGLALRLSLILEFLCWCVKESDSPAPSSIAGATFADAADLVASYFLPMAARIYGDAGVRAVDRNAATLPRWIVRERPSEVHVRHLQREVRLPGLTDAQALHEAAKALMEAGWLTSRRMARSSSAPAPPIPSTPRYGRRSRPVGRNAMAQSRR